MEQAKMTELCVSPPPGREKLPTEDGESEDAKKVAACRRGLPRPHKDLLSVLLFTVLLPLLDVLSDLRAGCALIGDGHSAWGAAVVAFTFIPCALRVATAAGMAILPRRCWSDYVGPGMLNLWVATHSQRNLSL